MSVHQDLVAPLAAGDYLKDKYQTKIAVVEALECPTLLHGGYGEHNIQGIGDKHVPLIHNVMNTDFVWLMFLIKQQIILI